MGFFIIVTDIFYFVCLFSLCVQVFLCGCEHVWVHGVCVCLSLCFSLWDEGDLTEWMNDWVTLSVCSCENIRGTLLDDVQFILDWFIFSLKSFYLTLWFWDYFKMCIIKISKARSREIYLDCSLCNLGTSHYLVNSEINIFFLSFTGILRYKVDLQQLADLEEDFNDIDLDDYM